MHFPRELRANRFELELVLKYAYAKYLKSKLNTTSHLFEEEKPKSEPKSLCLLFAHFPEGIITSLIFLVSFREGT